MIRYLYWLAISTCLFAQSAYLNEPVANWTAEGLDEHQILERLSQTPLRIDLSYSGLEALTNGGVRSDFIRLLAERYSPPIPERHLNEEFVSRRQKDLDGLTNQLEAQKQIISPSRKRALALFVEFEKENLEKIKATLDQRNR